MEAYAGREEALSGEDEGWIAAGDVDGGGGDGAEDVPDLGALSLEPDARDDENDDDVPDMEDFEDEDDDAVLLPAAMMIAKEAGAANGGADDDHIVKTARHDISITSINTIRRLACG